MLVYITAQIHQLDGQVYPLGGTVGGLGRKDVLLAQDRRVTLDEKSGALRVVGDDAIAKDDPFTGLEFNFKGHCSISTPLILWPCKASTEWRTGSQGRGHYRGMAGRLCC